MPISTPKAGVFKAVFLLLRQNRGCRQMPLLAGYWDNLGKSIANKQKKKSGRGRIWFGKRGVFPRPSLKYEEIGCALQMLYRYYSPSLY